MLTVKTLTKYQVFSRNLNSMQILKVMRAVSLFHFCINFSSISGVNSVITDLQGKSLKVSVITGVPSRVALNTISNGAYSLDRGLYSSIIKEFEKAFNFTTIPFPSAGGGGSGNLKNGSWSGAMGDVVSGRADIGFCAGITSLRYQYADLAGVMELMVLSFATGKQPPEFTWLAIFSPFTNEVWIACGVSIIFGFGTLVALTVSTAAQIKYSDILMQFEFIFSAFLEKGSKPPGLKGNVDVKYFTGFWCLLGLTIGTAYKSKLVELLAFPLHPEVPKDFDELVIRADYKWGLQFYGGLAYDLFRLSTNPTMTRISDKLELEPDAVKCYGRSVNSKFACITYSTMAEYTILKDFTNRHGRSHLTIAKKSREFFVAVGPVVKKGSDLQEPFQWAMGKIVDAGLVEKWKNMDYAEVRRKKFEGKRRVDDDASLLEEESEEIVLTLKNLKGGFALLFVGSAVSSIAFCVEMYRSLSRAAVKINFI